jgi:hypothetical protein
MVVMRNDEIIRYQEEDGTWTIISIIGQYYNSFLIFTLLFTVLISPMSSAQCHVLPKSVKFLIHQAVDKIIDEELIAGRIRECA